ncbi:MAG TPA: hypothetical protein VKQ70_07435, partial [Caulobacteraceae bacterium]|nr:hypothetical protein [Caulobacteraceae bacterium]
MASSDVQIEACAFRAAADWHAVWLVGLGLCAVLWPTPAGSDLNFALGAAAAPGLVGQLLRWRRGPVARTLTILAWPLGAGLAIALSGGLTGPLAALALAPAAAMAALDGRRFMALAVSLTLA